jgi:hypothetical protein
MLFAEPLSQRRAMIPMLIMRALAIVMRLRGRASAGDYGEGEQLRVMEPAEFGELFKLHAWQRESKHYQYAVCAKPVESKARSERPRRHPG